MGGADLVLLWSLHASATPLPTPEAFNGAVEVVQSERWGWWEKSLVLTLPGATRVLSTNEGFVEAQLVVNHAAHPSLWVRAFQELEQGGQSGGDVYLAGVKSKTATDRGVTEARIALTGTAVDMDHLAVVTQRFDPFVVTALVTAGASSNAHRAGTDSGNHIETAGTVNIILYINAQLTDAAMLNAVMMATEAKTAAFQDLNVASTYTPEAQATGTGTDTVIVIPSATGPVVPYAGAHAKVGELIAKATHQAVRASLIAHDRPQK